RDLLRRLEQSGDSELKSEVQLVRNVHETFAALTGRDQQPIAHHRPARGDHPLAGPGQSLNPAAADYDVVEFSEDGGVRFVNTASDGVTVLQETWDWIGGGLPGGASGRMTLTPGTNIAPKVANFQVRGDRLWISGHISPHEFRRFEFRRVSTGEVPAASATQPPTAIDSLTGLPPRRPSR